MRAARRPASSCSRVDTRNCSHVRARRSRWRRCSCRQVCRALPKPVVLRLMKGLSARERERLVGLADRAAPDRWRSLLACVGREEAIEPLLVGVVTAAVAELLPPPRWLVAMREGTTDSAPGPLNVLASLLHPEGVWSIDDALDAAARAKGMLPPDCVRAVFSLRRPIPRDATHRTGAPSRAFGRPRASAPRGAAHDRTLARGSGSRCGGSGRRRGAGWAAAPHLRAARAGARAYGTVAQLALHVTC